MASVKVKFRPSTIEGKEGTIYYQIIQNREAVSKYFEMAFFVSAKKIGQALTSLSKNLPVSLIFCILGNQTKISQR